MKQSSMDFQELPDDPVLKAEQDVVWWLVNRIRTRADALEAFRVASNCVTAAGSPAGSTSHALKIRAALGSVGDALATWDDAGTTDADKLQLWEALDAILASRSRDTVRADRAACIHYGRLLFGALRHAYAVQKHGNAAAARMGKGVKG